ncbi:MAG: NADH-quinone oxidoreductase subunit C [Candidatus Bathyarchaeia archaeon]
MSNSEVLNYIKKILGESITSYEKIHENRVVLTISKERMIDAIKSIFDKYDCARLSAISVFDDYLDFELIYSISIKNLIVNLKVILPKEDSKIDSIAKIIPGANWMEREIQDLFGIVFNGHPNPKKLLLAFEWPNENPPMRLPMKGILKDFQKPTMESLLRTGQIFPLTLMTKSQRAKLNLPDLPPTTLAQEKALNEVQELSKKVGFDKKIGYDWRTKKVRY